MLPSLTYFPATADAWELVPDHNRMCPICSQQLQSGLRQGFVPIGRAPEFDPLPQSQILYSSQTLPRNCLCFRPPKAKQRQLEQRLHH